MHDSNGRVAIEPGAAVVPRWRRWARRFFVAGLIGLSLTVIIRGYEDPHRVFAFQPFREASAWRAEIYREVGGDLVLVSAPWPGQYRWSELVVGRGLGHPEPEKHAVGSIDSILDLLQRALDYVAANTPRDAETRRLVAEVTYWRNGRGPNTTVLTSPVRISEP